MKVEGSGESRVLSREQAVALVARLRAARQTVVFTNGVFDLLHPGHVRYLEVARSLGDVLILGLNADASVRRNKGPGAADHARTGTRRSARRARRRSTRS